MMKLSPTARRFCAYLGRVITAFDVFVNVVCGGLQDETISSRWQRADQIGGRLIPRIGSIVLTWIQPHHGSSALKHDHERAAIIVAIESEKELTKCDS